MKMDFMKIGLEEKKLLKSKIIENPKILIYLTTLDNLNKDKLKENLFG